MIQAQHDQRGTRRFALRLPVTVRFADQNAGEVAAQTKDVSARGVFFYLDSNIEEGSRLEFTLTLPPEITLTESIRVRCKGRVVRVDPASPDGKVGIAAIIEQYEFLAEQ
ncbi:MAG TPA: PilZ domain-containing protein [Terriglobales bacterium]|nr:PilZ domain-containing protein [Terriglobales bacterium]